MRMKKKVEEEKVVVVDRGFSDEKLLDIETKKN